MGFSTGTAASASELLDAIRTVSLSNGWADVHYASGTNWVGVGSGLSGTDEIYLEFTISGSDLYVRGAQGHYPGRTTLDFCPMVLSSLTQTVLEYPVDYWVIVNAQRIMLLLKFTNNGTHFLTTYAGFFNLFVPKRMYPFPMLIGTSTYNTFTNQSGAFYMYGNRQAIAADGVAMPDGVNNTTMSIRGVYSTGGNLSGAPGLGVDGVTYQVGNMYCTYRGAPSWVYSTGDYPCCYGYLDGVHVVHKNAVAPGEIIIIDGVQYVAAPSYGEVTYDTFGSTTIFKLG